MSHGLILGKTETGKTTLAKQMSKGLKARGRSVLVLNDWDDPKWPCDYLTTELDDFLVIAKGSQNCVLFVDEAGSNCGQWDKAAVWLGTQSRHWGHSAFFMAQRYTLLNTNIRTQCRCLYLFSCVNSDIELIVKDWGIKQLQDAIDFDDGTFFYVDRNRKLSKHRITLPKEKKA